MIHRRDFLALTAAGTLAAPLRAFAQPAPITRSGGRPALIGALVTQTSAQSDIDTLGPFRKGMADLGYVEGRDYVIEARYADGDATRYPSMARDIVALSPDLIVANAGPAALAVRQLTSAIPILAGNVDVNDLSALTDNVARPSSNITGIYTDLKDLPSKQSDIGLELRPTAARVGALVWSLSTDAGATTRASMQDAARVHGFTAVMIDVAQPADIIAAFHRLADAQVDFAIVGSGNAFSANRQATASAAAAVGIPTIYNEQGYVEAGGLISYGFSRRVTYTRAASLAQLLLTGLKPSEVPFEETAGYFLAINTTTAKTLGLAIPPTLLFRADEVVP